MVSLIVNHLWQSTLFAVGVALLAHIMRRNSAKLRYALWLTASLKFLIPFALLTMLGAHISWRSVGTTPPSLVVLIDTIAEPLAAPGPTMREGVSSPALVSKGTVLNVLVVIWACGALAVFAFWLKRWRQIRRALHASISADIHFPIPVRSSPMLLEPGVFGLLRPVLLVPEGIEGRLSADQLRAVLAHELCHVRRRDNLTATFHMVVEALLWFHPIVWWLGARLIAEREGACDEEVLLSGTNPETYAEGILRVCQHYLESPLICAAGVSGANLKTRIEVIMKNEMTVHLTSAKKILLTSVTAATLVLPVVVGLLTSPRVTAQPANAASAIIAFDKVTLSRATAEGSALLGRTDQSFIVHNMPLRAVVARAYDVEQFLVVGGPDWLDKPLYDIDAQPGLGPEPGSGIRPLKTMLVDRFNLQAHREVRELPGFVLRVDGGGSKLNASPALAVGLSGGRPPVPQLLMDAQSSELADGQLWMRHVQLTGTYTDMKDLARTLSSIVGRPVLDQTGLTGRYDFSLKVTQTPNKLSAALREQLGLQLEATTAPVNVIVVDDVQQPTLDVESTAKSSADVRIAPLVSHAAASR
jgi:bla regulator protein BlaR1